MYGIDSLEQFAKIDICPITLYCDNNPARSSAEIRVKLDWDTYDHWEKITLSSSKNKVIVIKYIEIEKQLADILTKPLAYLKHVE